MPIFNFFLGNSFVLSKGSSTLQHMLSLENYIIAIEGLSSQLFAYQRHSCFIMENVAPEHCFEKK